jgi:hypothetical protein
MVVFRHTAIVILPTTVILGRQARKQGLPTHRHHKRIAHTPYIPK